MGTAAMVGQLRLGDHVCWTADDNRVAVLAGLAADGLAAGHRIVYLTESLYPAMLLAGLAAHGVPVGPAQEKGQLKVLPAQRVCLPDGEFDPQRLLDTVADHIDRAHADGYPGLRLVADMTWALDQPLGADRLTRYEAETNRLFLDGQALGICLYDRRAVPRNLLRDVAGAHPATTPAQADADWVPLLRVCRTADGSGLRLFGEADLSNRQALAAVLHAVATERPDRTDPVPVDVSGLRFADAGTAGLLVRAARAAPAGLHVTGCHGDVAVMLDRLGVDQVPGVRISPGEPVPDPYAEASGAELVA